MKKLVVVLLTLLVLSGVTGCGPAESDKGKESDGSDTIKLGTFGPYEGEVSVYGIAVRNGINLAIEDYNANSDVLGKKVELVSYDTKADAIEAVNAYNKLVEQDKVTAIIGGVTSGESMAAAEASLEFNTPILSPSATGLEFVGIGPNIFRACYTDPIQANALADFTFNNLKIDEVAILYNSGLDYSTGLTDVYKERFTSLGGTIIAQEAYADGDTDFNAQLTSIASSKPKVVFVPDYYQVATLIMKQAKALGLDTIFLGADGWDGILSINESDSSFLEGAIFSNHYSPEEPTIKDWETRYIDTYDMVPNAFAFLAYDSTTLMLDAINKAGSEDSQAIIDALYTTNYNGILGNLVFDSNGDPKKDVAYITIKDGEYTTFK